MAGRKSCRVSGNNPKGGQKIDVLVLAAGEGIRMRPLTANTPKPLLPVAGKPFLEHTVMALKACGLRNIHILLGWRDEKIKDHFGRGEKFGVSIEYLEQPERLGTAHAVSMADGSIKSDFLCLNGDVVVTSEMLEGIIATARKKKCTVMTATKVTEPSGYGILHVDSGMKLKRIIEKPDKFVGDLANAGIYYFTPNIFQAIKKTERSPRGEYEITDSIQMLADVGKVCVHVAKRWIDVTRPWDLLAANEMLMKDIEAKVSGEIEKNSTIKGPVSIGKGAVVRGGAYIIGPAIIGNGSEIGPNCLIRPYTYIGDNCKVGNACEVKNSIVMHGSHVPHLNYVGDSIIGERCNLGAGTKIANLRFDDRNVPVIQKGKKVNSGRRKLGVIMGDDVQTGINSSIDAGTIICEGAMIGPGAVVHGYIAPKSRIY